VKQEQYVVSCSSCEAEFRVMATTTREIVHVRRLLADFDIFLTTLTPLTYDNQSSVQFRVS